MRKNPRIEKPTLLELVMGITVVALVIITLLAMFTPQRRQRTSATRLSSGNSLKQVFYAPANGTLSNDVRMPSPDR